MDRDLRPLVRRPLLTLGSEGYVVEAISAREPHRTDRLTNRVRKIGDKFVDRKFRGKTAYNRKQRALYQQRVPSAQRKARPGHALSGDKRRAPEKRIGSRIRVR